MGCGRHAEETGDGAESHGGRVGGLSMAQTSSKALAYIKCWKRANPDKVAQHRKTWRARHPNYMKNWRRKNQKKVQAYRVARMAD
jgi:hypothetical protein